MTDDEATPGGPARRPAVRAAGDGGDALRLARATIDRLEAALEAREAEVTRLTAVNTRIASEALSEARRENAALRLQLAAMLEQGGDPESPRGTVDAGPAKAGDDLWEAPALRADLLGDRELEQIVSAYRVALDAAKGDIDRAAASRAWRYGHFATRSLRRATLRGSRTDGALARARRRIEATEAAHGALRGSDEAGGPARRRALEAAAEALADGLAGARNDIERAAASRAWRYGHGATLIGRRLLFRRTGTEGALARAAERLRHVERVTRAMPLAAGDALAAPASAPALAPGAEAPREEDADPAVGVAVLVGTRDLAAAAAGGDLPFARALGRAFERRGTSVRVATMDEWEGRAPAEIVIVLRGRAPYVPRPASFNVLWCISHPADLSPEECDGYDLVCVASDAFAQRLRPRTRTTVAVLRQATDPDVFRSAPTRADGHDLVYVANSRGETRPIVRDLLPTTLDLAVWGAGWDGLVDPRQLVAEHVANDRLHEVYSSAGAVLADHWDDMRDAGFVGNRVYDALACGAIVISDAVAGLDERFPSSVRVYRSPDELRSRIGEVLAMGDEARERLGREARAWILRGETFDHRADRLSSLVDDELQRRGTAAGRPAGPGHLAAARPATDA